jgi:hypothetical protein
MQNLKFIIAISITGLLFHACDCSKVDCSPPDENFANFRIVSANDGTDLVFGPNKIYDKNQLQFYTINGSDTSFFENKLIKYPGVGYDSLIYVFFPDAPGAAFIKLSNADTDTLDMTYQTVKTECCGSTKVIANYRYNNSIDIPGTSAIQEIKK